MDPLQKLAIRGACEELVTRYCHYVDHGQAARVAELFTDDGEWASGRTVMKGRAELAAGFRRRQDNAARMSRHVCQNFLCEVIDEDHAEGVVYLTLYRHDGEPGRAVSPLDEQPELVGEYRDRFVRTVDGWRFARREIDVSFFRGK